MLTRLVRRQLVAFAAVTIVVLAILMLNYVKLPAVLGFGRYEVTANLPEAGGLYPRANVTYRGHEVGVVTSVDLRGGGGVVARLQIDDGVKIPRSAQVQVRSVSALGEQYLDLVPDPEKPAVTCSRSLRARSRSPPVRSWVA
jgi:phospholipid/cholesterol/gamma-HCH transport system substrate-binding protein